jgi:hypothetical protein
MQARVRLYEIQTMNPGLEATCCGSCFTRENLGFLDKIGKQSVRA